MIRRLIKAVGQLVVPGVKSGGRRRPTEPEVYTAQGLGIDLSLISSAAFKTVRGLQEAGYEAFIVGGGVRDLLLDIQPKDFDVATDATPQEVQRVFRRARIIGRRFQIVHVTFGQEIIEVSTFRALQASPQKTDDHGRVLSDNVFGEQHEDAARRDFTVNALYLDPTEGVVLDYHRGVRDLKARVLRMIGDPASRFREDPVRMLRVVRFMAKLNFDVEPKTMAPVRGLGPLLSNVPQARLFDEMVKLLMSGASRRGLELLMSLDLHHQCLPLVEMALEPEGNEQERKQALAFVHRALSDTDLRISEGRKASPSFLFACLLWHPVLRSWRSNEAKGERPIPALHAAIDEVVEARLGELGLQRRTATDMRELWQLQPRFERRGGSLAAKLLEHERFKAAYDFLLLRADSGEVSQALADWWVAYFEGDDDTRLALVEGLSKAQAGETKPRRRRRRRGPSE